MSQKPHWERIYTSQRPSEVGWYAPHLTTSLTWIDELCLPLDAPIIDVGGGVSTLVDDLLAQGHGNITVLDISGKALSVAKTRLGKLAEQVTWIEGDITDVDLPQKHFAVWHDRAVFHFLITQEQRRLYVSQLNKSVRPGGHLIIGTFATDAPPRCSGLPVERYSPDRLQEALGSSWSLVRTQRELHLTPSGVEQMYLYCELRHAA